MIIKEQSFVLSCREVRAIAVEGEFSSNFIRLAYNVHLGDCDECLDFVCDIEASVPVQSFPMKRLGQTAAKTLIAPEKTAPQPANFLRRWLQWRPRMNTPGLRLATAGVSLALLLGVSLLGWRQFNQQPLVALAQAISYPPPALSDYSFLSPNLSTPTPPPDAAKRQPSPGIVATVAENETTYGAELVASVVHKPDILAELVTTAGTIRGSQTSAPGRVITPTGAVMVNPRPIFRWTPIPGATSYAITVGDVNQYPVLESGPLSGDITTWQAPRSLPGGAYSWSLVAQVGEKKVVLPDLEQPEAKFALLSAKQRRARTQLLRQARPSLPLAVFYAQAGMVAEARGELRSYLRRHPQNVAARQLQQRIRHW